jgi:hypothetical protein
LEPCGCTQDRLSTGNGRVYLIVVKATDAGGTGFGTATAAVPTSSSSTNMAAVNAEAAAAKTAAAANHGTRRGGYSVVGDHRPPVRPRASAAVRRARCRRGIGHSTRRGTTGRGDSARSTLAFAHLLRDGDDVSAGALRRHSHGRERGKNPYRNLTRGRHIELRGRSFHTRHAPLDLTPGSESPSPACARISGNTGQNFRNQQPLRGLHHY